MELLTKTCNYEKMNIERLVARLFVVAGGVFWAAAAFGAGFRYQDLEIGDSVALALIPLAVAVVALVVGWFYEVLIAAALFVGVVGVAVWGLVSGWEPGVWLTMTVVLMAPMAVSGVLYLMAARMQNVCTLEEAM